MMRLFGAMLALGSLLALGIYFYDDTNARPQSASDATAVASDTPRTNDDAATAQPGHTSALQDAQQKPKSAAPEQIAEGTAQEDPRVKDLFESALFQKRWTNLHEEQFLVIMDRAPESDKQRLRERYQQTKRALAKEAE